MEELISFQNNILDKVDNKWHRHLFPHLLKDERLLGIKGLRGVGKTTLLLQYLAHEYPEREKGLYITVDHPYFYSKSLFELAGEWEKNGGSLLLIDEVHKYKNWSRELKLIYDGFPDLQVIFTSSSALDLFRGESDLSRRLITQTLHGLSFREYLNLRHGIEINTCSFEEILSNHQKLTREILQNFKPIPYFKKYLIEGYFPFINQINEETLPTRLLQVINTVLETDISFIHDYSASHIEKIKKLLGVIASSAPFEPNISKIAGKLNIGRNTVNIYLKHLEDAFILQLLNKDPTGISRLQKPDKIYFENTCFAYAFQNTPEFGTLRETFFINQLKNAGHKVNLSSQGDFLVDEKVVFEIGGRNKTARQIKETTNSFLAVDDIEHGFGKKIPLWLFGFLY